MEIIYRACDGTEFETEEGCRRYEEYLKADPKDFGVIMLDRNDKATNDINQVYFVAFKNEEGQKLFVDKSNREGYIVEGIEEFVPNKTNAYIFKNGPGEYVLLEDYLRPLKEEIERYENLWSGINDCTEGEEDEV